MAAVKVEEDGVKAILVVSGGVLCFLGLLYGGFWRTEMRKKFKLPENAFCCGSSTVTDYVQWVFCCPCSLAQEVRTAKLCWIEEDGFDRMMKVYKGWPEFVPSTRKGCLSSTEIERTGTLAHIEVLTDMQRETESSDAAKVPAFQRISKVEKRPLGSVELGGEAPKISP
ncbi:hypothetical protein HPP92_013865 [Vanilla planifolia]|uniref:Uncharacterized protein n=1 Tax=Vanilla planifolia TaxID=51239 RepID=A0A835UV64_VANPL|nr:hypothetical protein HPP92_013865 [Vanilla planifolia]